MNTETFSIRLRIWASLAALAAAALAAPAHAADWGRPRTLTSFSYLNLPTNTASVAVLPNGDSVAVWTNEANGSVQFARQIQGVWSTARKLYRASVAKGETTTDSRVVIDADGSAIAIFSSTIPGQMQYCVIGGRIVRCKGPDKSYAKVSTLAAGASGFTVPVNVSGQGIGVAGTQIGIDASGNAMAMWRFVEQAGAVPAVQIAERPAGGDWSAPQTILSTPNGLLFPALAVGAAGDAMIAWEERTTTPGILHTLRSLYRPAGDAWGAPEDVATQLGQAWTLRAGVDASGSAALAWDDAYSVRLARRSPLAGWGAPDTITSGPGRTYGPAGPFFAYVPDLASNSAGDVLIAWLESETATGGWTIEVDLQLSGGPAVHESWAVDTVMGLPAPHVALSDDRSSAVAAWADNGAGTAFAATLTPLDGAWSQPAALGDALWDTTVAVGSGAGGSASAVWLWGNVTRFSWQFRASSYR